MRPLWVSLPSGTGADTLPPLWGENEVNILHIWSTHERAKSEFMDFVRRTKARRMVVNIKELRAEFDGVTVEFKAITDNTEKFWGHRFDRVIVDEYSMIKGIIVHLTEKP